MRFGHLFGPEFVKMVIIYITCSVNFSLQINIATYWPGSIIQLFFVVFTDPCERDRFLQRCHETFQNMQRKNVSVFSCHVNEPQILSVMKMHMHTEKNLNKFDFILKTNTVK